MAAQGTDPESNSSRKNNTYLVHEANQTMLCVQDVDAIHNPLFQIYISLGVCWNLALYECHAIIKQLDGRCSEVQKC